MTGEDPTSDDRVELEDIASASHDGPPDGVPQTDAVQDHKDHVEAATTQSLWLAGAGPVTGGSPVRQSEVTMLLDYLAPELAEVITRILTIRTSDESGRNFGPMFLAGIAMLPDDDDVAVLRAIGPRIVLPEGAADRERLHAMELRSGSVPGGTGTRLLGWLVPIGRTLFVLYLSSARKADMRGETPDQSKNLFTEAFCEIIRRLKPEEVRTPIFTRLVRNLDHGAQLLRTLRTHHVKLYVANVHRELQGSEAQLANMIESWFAAKDADDTVDRLGGIEANIYAAGEWYLTPMFLPFTWRPVTCTRVNPITLETETVIPDPHKLEATPGSVEVFDAMYLMLIDASQGLDGVGRSLGKLGVRSRAPKNFKDPKTLDELAQPGSAVTTLISRRWLDAWRSGVYRTSVQLKSDLRVSHPGLADMIAERANKHGEIELWMDVAIALPAPPRGYWLTNEMYDLILEVRHADTPQRVGRAASNGDRRPLSSLSQWSDQVAGREYRLGTFDSTATYTCLWRPLTTATEGNDRTAGWAKEHKRNKLASIPARNLHQSIGQALLDLDEQLDAGTTRLVLPPREVTADPHAPLRRQVAEVEHQIGKLTDRLAGIREDRQEARGRKDSAEVERLDADKDKAQEALETLTRDVTALTLQLETTGRALAGEEVTHDTVDVSTLEHVAVALMRCGTHAPAALNDALAGLLRDLRVVPDASGLWVTWTASVELRLGSGERARHDIGSSAPVPGIAFTVHAEGAEPAPDWDDRLAEAVFDRGEDVTMVCSARGLNGSGKADSYVIKRLKGWLAAHSVATPDLCSAALDAPPEVRRALARALRGSPGLTPYERHLRDTYTCGSLAWPTTWAASAHRNARALQTAVELIGSEHANPIQAAQLAGLTWSEMLEVTGRRRIARLNKIPHYVGPALNRNWSRGAAPRSGMNLTVHRCPHNDCLGKKHTRRPGILIQLLVPELGPSGLICRDCRRSPDHVLIVFPETYLLPWVGGRRTHLVDEHGPRWIGSHLEPPRT